MSLVEICYKLGITEERKESISDLIHGKFQVVRKETHRNEYMPAPLAEEHYVIFNDEKHTIKTINDGWYESFKKGDLVELDYRSIVTNVMDYVPPDFDQKKVIRIEKNYRVEEVNKIDNFTLLSSNI
jgi:hypothetical protein